MFHGVFRTKEGKVIIAIMGLTIIIIGGFVITGFIQERKFEEKAAMAENYLNAGSYEQAIDAYEQALSMKNSDQELLTVGLSDAYIGIEEYDKALEVLRSCYQKTSGFLVKEKIEEIIAEKTEYEYLQSISRAKVYFKNKEYEKAIEEYEEAKQIKSKDATAFQGIADSYIKLGKYDLAKEEILEGQVITRDKNLELTLAVVDAYLRRDEYDTLLKQAAEYFSQENYEEGVLKLKKAIYLMPKENEAYSQLTQMYLSKGEYEKAIPILKNAIKLTDSNELKSMLLQVKETKALEDEKNKLLNRLFSALMNRNIAEVTKIMKLSIFTKDFNEEIPVCYPSSELDKLVGNAMVLYDNKTVYYGEFNNGKRKGKGIYLTLIDGSLDEGYYYYDGHWDKNIPNGSGKTVEEKTLSGDNNVSYISCTTTEGNFVNAVEDGRMIKYFSVDGADAGKLIYTAKKGVPVPLASENRKTTPTPEASFYVIGIISIDNAATGDYYRVEPQTIWGVKPFINKQ